MQGWIEDILADLYLRMVISSGYRYATFVASKQMMKVFNKIGFLWEQQDENVRVFKEIKWVSYDPHHSSRYHRPDL